MKHFFRYLAIAMLLVSCGGDPDPVVNPETPPTPPPTPSTPVTPTATIESSAITPSSQSITYSDTSDKLTVNFADEKGELTFNLKTSDSWTAKSTNTRADSWASLSPTSGSKGETSIKITAQDNDSYGERTADWEITCGTTKKTVRIVQKQNNAVIVTESKAEVAAEGGVVSIEVQHNIDVTVTVDDAAKAWITKSETRALSKDTYSFNVAANDDLNQREGKIYVKSSLGEETFTVYQTGSGPMLILGQKEYTVSGDGDQVEIEVTSNVNVSYEIVEGNEWLSESTTRALSTDKYVFIAAMNETYDSRDAVIVFKTEDGSLTEQVVVKQAAKDALIVAANEYTVPCEANTLSFVVSANVDFTVETNVTWIKQVSTRGLTDTILNFSVEANTNDEVREGKITIKSGSLKQEIKIVQNSTSVFSLSCSEISIDANGGPVEIAVTSNMPVNVKVEGAEWIEQTTTRSSTTSTYVFNIKKNESYDSREGKITFYTDEGHIGEVTVLQAAKGALIIAANEYTVPSEANTLSFVVSANVDFTVETGAEWIKQVSTRGLTDTTLNFNIEENTAEAERRAQIFISNENGLTQTINILQRGKTPKIAEISGFQFFDQMVDKNKITECYFNVKSDITTANKVDIPPYLRSAPIYCGKSAAH